MLPLSIVKGSDLSGATFFFSEYKYKTEAGSSPGGSTTSCNQKSLTANYQIERSDDRMCSDLINQGEGTSFLSYPLFCLLAWLLGSTTLYRSGFFFLIWPLCLSSICVYARTEERTNRCWLHYKAPRPPHKNTKNSRLSNERSLAI